MLLVGMKGLGAEIAKNLILAGVKGLTMLDHEQVRCAAILSLSFTVSPLQYKHWEIWGVPACPFSAVKGGLAGVNGTVALGTRSRVLAPGLNSAPAHPTWATRGDACPLVELALVWKVELTSPLDPICAINHLNN